MDEELTLDSRLWADESGSVIRTAVSEMGSRYGSEEGPLSPRTGRMRRKAYGVASINDNKDKKSWINKEP